MSDDVDRANDVAQASLDAAIAAARVAVPDGEPGECRQCFEDMPRLVGGRCGFCRDGRTRR